MVELPTCRLEGGDYELTVMVRDTHAASGWIGHNRRMLPVAAHVLAGAVERLSVVIARIARLLIGAGRQWVLLTGHASGHRTRTWSDRSGISATRVASTWIAATWVTATWVATTLPLRVSLRSHHPLLTGMMMVVAMVVHASLHAARPIAARTVPEVWRLRNLREVLRPLAKSARRTITVKMPRAFCQDASISLLLESR